MPATRRRCVYGNASRHELIFLLLDAYAYLLMNRTVCIHSTRNISCPARRRSSLRQWKRAPNDDARAEGRRGNPPLNRYDINTFNVSKTFRDGRTGIDENPILIAEPRPAPRRAARHREQESIDRSKFSKFVRTFAETVISTRSILDAR